MFTGIVQERGKILKIKKEKGKTVFTIESEKVLPKLKIGSSIAINGICLTVVDLNDKSFTVEAIPETLKRTNLGELKKNDFVNLEPSLTITDEIGGHFVMGHIDGTGEIISLTQEGDSVLIEVKPPKELLKYIAFKGAIALDGVSLTIAKLKKESFIVALIPHTLKVTNLSKKKVGDKVNIEVDMVTRYLERLVSADKEEKVTLDLLKKKGFVED